jgi:hypothetical protein
MLGLFRNQVTSEQSNMAYRAQVIPIMIASPADVSAEREIATDVIYRWNAIYARQQKHVLLPVKWETHSSSDLGGRAQQQINDRVLRFCDLLVGIFWTRLGTPTGKAESGTAEEIKEHLLAGKPAMVFFSRQPAAPETFDPADYARLKQFKEWCREQGITWDYDSPQDFGIQFNHQLQLLLHSNPYLGDLLHRSKEAGDEVAPPSPPAPEMPEMSAEAIELLSSASKDRGQILVADTIGGRIIQCGKQQFGSSDRRIAAKYDFALEELEAQNFIKAKGIERQLFQITKLGYDLLDRLGA